MAILCLGRSLRLDGYAFIGELALDGSVRPVTGVLPMASCLRAAGVRRLAVANRGLYDFTNFSTQVHDFDPALPRIQVASHTIRTGSAPRPADTRRSNPGAGLIHFDRRDRVVDGLRQRWLTFRQGCLALARS
jgi:hypothetical protein